ncbi:uncharacterized protein CELE_F58D12.1 [Caenorhabditis elegans]|uniref:Uncharacterized protein n=1 Tax=Caenorhabditis elegans TaxID=6239 RepID=O02276_CAEEL|nr:Uncharacterized protein CELE_F58D12.1 [Caenorhabditis elegans]CAB03144.4 Uncharacterized protein CELE_F58D12.1 [Caenorhabditis elegans]|eukprot:NP_001343571.1 Uncharacterized protein CELE_F58D12.1 [Caenorhabditis elegans]
MHFPKVSIHIGSLLRFIVHHVRHLHQLLRLQLLDLPENPIFFSISSTTSTIFISFFVSSSWICQNPYFFFLIFHHHQHLHQLLHLELLDFLQKSDFFLLIVHLHRLLHPLLRLELLDFAEKGDPPPLHKMRPLS